MRRVLGRLNARLPPFRRWDSPSIEPFSDASIPRRRRNEGRPTSRLDTRFRRVYIRLARKLYPLVFNDGSVMDYAQPTAFTITKDGGGRLAAVKTTPDAKDYLMYYSLKMFFSNGGGRCYVVSLSKYEDTPAWDKAKFIKGLQSLEMEDEPTVIVFTDAVNHAGGPGNAERRPEGRQIHQRHPQLRRQGDPGLGCADAGRQRQ